MILFKQGNLLQEYLSVKKTEGKTIGFVPTMGALHDGHLSLIKRSKSKNAITVCSIYVNPTQFNDSKDLEKYPRPIERDIELLVSVNCDILFLPSTEEIYPNGINALKNYNLGHLENFLEGASRPGHFKGVANVVDRLLQIVQPERLYLGQKDFQQVKVIEFGIQNSEFGIRKVELVMCEIVRQEDGLAMSSRNVRLNEFQRMNAVGISKELFFIRDHWKEYQLSELKHEAVQYINSIPEAHVDYLEFCDAEKFAIINNWNEAEHIVCVTSVIIGGIRLLDNVLIS